MNIEAANQILDLIAGLGALIFMAVAVGVSMRRGPQEAVFWVTMAILMQVTRL